MKDFLKVTANTVIASIDSERFQYTEEDIPTNDELICTVLSVILKSFGKNMLPEVQRDRHS